MLATRPDKRFTEVFVLAYTPVWIAAVIWAMTSGVLRTWGELEHMLFGVALALPLAIAPLVPRKTAPPIGERHATRFVWLITLFAVLQCWFGSYLFFDVFGMQYRFRTSIVWNGTPAFLYLMTIAYFATYYVVQVVIYRVIRHRVSNAILLLLARAALAYATALAETAGMANDLLADWFSYRDREFVMWVGSIAYGAIFFITLPLFADLDEKAPARPPLRAATTELLALTMVCLVVYEAYRIVVGPFTP